MKNNKYKVAVQLYGHLRTFNKCSYSLKKHILDKYDCDIYLHTWNELDHSSKTWHSFKMKNTNIENDEIICQLKRNYGDYLKDFKIEKQVKKDPKVVKVFNNEVDTCITEYINYAMSQANELRTKSKEKYDFVIMTRADIFFNKDFDIDFFIDKLDDELLKNSFFITSNNTTPRLNDIGYRGAVDLLWLSTPEVMSKVVKLTDEHLNFLRSKEEFNISPFARWFKVIENTGIKLHITKYILDEDYYILREANLKNKGFKVLSLRINKTYLQLIILNIRLKLEWGVGKK